MSQQYKIVKKGKAFVDIDGKTKLVYNNNGEPTVAFKKAINDGFLKELPDNRFIFERSGKKGKFINIKDIKTQKGEYKKSFLKNIDSKDYIFNKDIKKYLTIDEKNKRLLKNHYSGYITQRYIDNDVEKQNFIYYQLKTILKKQFKGKKVKIVAEDLVNNKLILSNEYSINYSVKDTLVKKIVGDASDSRLESGIEQGFWRTQPNVHLQIFELEQFNKLPKNVQKSKMLLQSFRDSKFSHCFFEPIKLWAQEKYDTATNKGTKNNYKSRLNNLIKDEIKYCTGIPQDKIQDFCNEYNINITIDLPLQTKFLEVKTMTSKKPLKIFKFMNTRINHIERYVCQTNVSTIVKPDELCKIYEELVDNNEFFEYKRNTKGCLSRINTLSHNYVVENPFNDIKNEFEKDFNMSHYTIDDIHQKKLTTFIKQSTHYLSTVQYYDEPEDINDCITLSSKLIHIDQKNSYASYYHSKYYKGILGKITDFRKTTKIQGLGRYRITNIDTTNANSIFLKHNNFLKILQDNAIYGSPFLSLLDDLNIKYDILEGIWGTKIEDFDKGFPDYMLENKNYAVWAGLCDSHNLINKSYFYASPEMAQLVLNNNNDDVKVYRSSNSEVVVETKKQFKSHLGHITAQLVEYSLINVINQLMKMDHSKIFKVDADGIYFLPHDFEMIKPYRIKEGNFLGRPSSNKFISFNSYADEDDTKVISTAPERENYLTELHLGAGGCGKTHIQLIDNGLIKPCYYSPSWKLATNKKLEYNCNIDVWYNLLHTDPTVRDEIKKKYNVLIIDEVSMLSEKQKIKILKEYKDLKIIFCGDIGFQLPPINYNILLENGKYTNKVPFLKAQAINIDDTETIIKAKITLPKKENAVKFSEEDKVMNSSNIQKVEHHNTNYRFKCDKLLCLTETIRKMIVDKYSKEKINYYIMNFFEKNNKILNKSQLKEIYEIDDMILASKHCFKNEYTNLFKGKFDKEKFYVTKNTTKCVNGKLVTRCNGDIIIGSLKDQPDNSEIRYAYTVHSIQGETAKNRLFIDIRNLFDTTMLYTALSRAKSLDQIYLIDDELETWTYDGRIYCISNGQDNYIGSTVFPIEERLKIHEQNYQKYLNKKNNKFITVYNIFKQDKPYIVKLLEDFKCHDVKDLVKREFWYIQNIECVNKMGKINKAFSLRHEQVMNNINTKFNNQKNTFYKVPQTKITFN
jgi:hypothetical protein